MTAEPATGDPMPTTHQYNVHEAKTHLSRILEEVEAGDEVVLSRAGKPVAKVVPIRKETPLRTPGLLRGQIFLSEDWDSDETNEAIARDFYESK